MRSRILASRDWIRSVALVGAVLVTGVALAAWKSATARAASAAAARQPEPIESVNIAVAKEREYRPTTTSVGTVLALESITLRNELAGTVRKVALVPGQVVETGAVLVALDVSVEQSACSRRRPCRRKRWTRHEPRATSRSRKSSAPAPSLPRKRSARRFAPAWGSPTCIRAST